MIIKVTVKQLGKKRDKISDISFYLENQPSTVRELIIESVHTCVKNYNQRVEQGDQVKPLSLNEIEEMSEIGKVAFGINYGKKKANEEEAIETALQAYEDGLVRIFVEEEQLASLDETIDLAEKQRVTFLKLTMLSGSMFG